MISNFDESVGFLKNLPYREVKPGLERTLYLLDRLGNPHLDFPSVHVGGTNGKGSVVAFMNSALSQNYEVGTFISPPLNGFADRFRIGGRKIPSARLSRYVNEIREAVAEVPREEDLPSLFEAATAIAAKAFSEADLDLAILEVGLGGRYDATSAIGRPLLSIITNVQLDHTDLLGENIEDVAFELAGIAGEGTPLVMGEIVGESRSVVEKECQEKEAPIRDASQEVKTVLQEYDWGQSTYRVERAPQDCLSGQGLRLRALGQFQAKNLATSLTALDALDKEGFALDCDSLKSGIEKAVWPGRFQVVHKRPYIVLDGAHNPAAAAALSSELGGYSALLNEDSKVLLVFSALHDKNISGMLEELYPQVDELILTELDHHRKTDVSQLAKLAQRMDFSYRQADSPREAFQLAWDLARREDLICITGSLYLTKEAIDFGFGG